MDKKNWMNYIFAGLPMIAVVLAGMGNSVTIYPPAATEAVYCSYFTLVEDIPGAICLPLAAFGAGVTFGLAVLYLVKRSALFLKIMMPLSFLSATAAVVPVLARGEILVIPNMLVPILLMAVCLTTYGMLKNPQRDEPKKEGKRLK